MIVDLIPRDARRNLDGSYKLRSPFWAVSACAHVVWIFIATQIHLTPPSPRPVYDEFIRPLERRVLIYRPPVKAASATPETRVGQTPDPRGKIKAPRVAIATAPQAKSQQQIVSMPVDLPEMKLDVPAPNVVARVETALPPPPPKAQPKQFVEPPRTAQQQAKSAQISAELAAAPAVTVVQNSPEVAKLTLPPAPKIPSKQFVAPPRATTQQAKNTEVAAELAAAPAVAVERNDLAAPQSLLPPAPKVAPKQFVAPTRVTPRQAKNTEVAAELAAAPAVAVAQNNPATPKPALPPAPKVAPKQFVAPARNESRPTVQAEVDASLPTAPAVALARNNTAAPASSLPPPPKIAPKAFTAPAASGRGAKQVSSTEVTAALAAAPTVSNSSVPSAVVSTGTLRNAPPAPPTRGTEQANVAIASISPAPSAQPPASPRSGQFSVAPATGEPSSGAASPSALVVPNLTVREPAAPKPEPAKSNTVIYAERVRASAATFTVPLRPANRSIPRAIDARFPGRSVYTVLIPIENIPSYGGDWILWFAEVTPLLGQTPSVKAPVPFRKLELLQKGRDSSDTRLQIAAILGADGKLRDAKVLSNAPATIQEQAVADINSWEWKPAMRNGVPVEIETVFEIPFRLPLKP